MKTVNGEQVLEYPTDLRGFTLNGIRLTRTTQLHERGVYEITLDRYRDVIARAVHAGSKRYPWVVLTPTGNYEIGYARDLIHVTQIVAGLRSRARGARRGKA